MGCTRAQVCLSKAHMHLGSAPSQEPSVIFLFPPLIWAKLPNYENQLNALKEKAKEPQAPEPEPEPTAEVLFLCSFDGCGKTFIDAGALRKHSHIHGEKQFVCPYEGCGKCMTSEVSLCFWNVSMKLIAVKLRGRVLHVHLRLVPELCSMVAGRSWSGLQWGSPIFIEPYGTGSLDLLEELEKGARNENLEMGKEISKAVRLSTYSMHHHALEKIDNIRNTLLNSTPEVVKYTTPPEMIPKNPKPPSGVYGSASSDRPYICPYEGCEKDYIHEYKLKLHPRREHPGRMADENAAPDADNELDEGSDQDAYVGKRVNGKSQKQSRSKPNLKMPPVNIIQRKGSSPSPSTLNVVKKPWPVKDETYEEEDSEETEEEDRDNEEGGWRYGGNKDDDEETEDED
ncbi:unnamed protein product [Dovyalis caffra]|uniref:C2H2-type domain-containing protein n=1 Tax=Dovyalis caffra TaxID=77055 RepID=A0AAV1STW1_9ROSI|nr:unnamed protein product [Dovyalis caffra]